MDRFERALSREEDESSNRDAIEERERALAKQLSEMKKKKQKLVDPIQYAFSIEAEDLANYEPTFAWEMGPATDKQIECLEKLGICADEVKNAGLASLLIEKLTNRHKEGLATPRQIRYLEKVEDIDYSEVARIIKSERKSSLIVVRELYPLAFKGGRGAGRRKAVQNASFNNVPVVDAVSDHVVDAPCYHNREVNDS